MAPTPTPKEALTSQPSVVAKVQHDVVPGMSFCPCCNRRLDHGRQTLGEFVAPPVVDALFKCDSYSDDESNGDMDEAGRMMPGILAEGEAYHIKKVVVQGWVYKKGTGMDWIGSRAWKARWACLAVSGNCNTVFSHPTFLTHSLCDLFLTAGKDRRIRRGRSIANGLVEFFRTSTFDCDNSRFYRRFFRRQSCSRTAME